MLQKAAIQQKLNKSAKTFLTVIPRTFIPWKYTCYTVSCTTIEPVFPQVQGKTQEIISHQNLVARKNVVAKIITLLADTTVSHNACFILHTVYVLQFSKVPSLNELDKRV